MIIVSYDISDDKMRTNFSKMLKSNGAIRLQFSVYEVSNTKRIVDNLVAKTYFSAYYQNQNWKGRHPRMKSDVLNVTLDIGYSILFNFMESFIRMFGFDLYVGVYHRLWFKRKSLVCDLMEPFRCIIDHATLLAFNRKQL